MVLDFPYDASKDQAYSFTHRPALRLDVAYILEQKKAQK